MEIIQYFKNCEESMPESRTTLRRSAHALRRSGLVTMEELCELQRRAPEKLADTRGVGVMGVDLIAGICGSYRQSGNTPD